jgi:hypothetical protein
VQHLFGDEAVDRSARFEGRRKAHVRVGPKKARVELVLDLLPNKRVSNRYEAADVFGIFAHYAPPKVEDVHLPSPTLDSRY